MESYPSLCEGGVVSHISSQLRPIISFLLGHYSQYLSGTLISFLITPQWARSEFFVAMELT